MIDIDNMTIGDAKRLAQMFGGSPQTISGGGRKVIVRAREAGVQFGRLIEYTNDGSLVTLEDARQMWSWTAAEGGTLLDCATHGVKAGKFSTPAQRVTIIGACAIIDCAEKAILTLEAAKWS